VCTASIVAVHPFVGGANLGEGPGVPERGHPEAAAQRFYSDRPRSGPSTAQRPQRSRPQRWALTPL